MFKCEMVGRWNLLTLHRKNTSTLERGRLLVPSLNIGVDWHPIVKADLVSVCT